MNDNERLSRELRDRAAHTGGHPISFDDVKRSANKMKWQQRAATGAVAAVVLAIGIPVGMSIAGGEGASNPPIAGTNTETPTPTQNPDPDGDGKVTLTLDAPEGDAPRVSYMQGKTLHLSDGSTQALPKAYDDVVSYHGDFMGLDYGAGKIDVVRDGAVVDSFPGFGFAVSVDGTEVAWYAGDANGGQIKRGIPSGMGEGEATQDVPVGYLVTKMVFTPGARLMYQLDNQNEPYDRTVWYTEFDGRATQVEGALAIGGYNNATGQVSVMTQLSDDGSCWALYSYGGGEASETFSKETCDYTLGEFSADGKYVMAIGPYQSGWGPGDVTILDATTLEPVIDFVRDQDYGMGTATWDGESDSLIAIVYLEGHWQLLRLAADGRIETVSKSVEADDLSGPFRLVSAR